MNADKREWIRMVALQSIFCALAMASRAKSEEPLFLLTPQIERLGGEALATDSDAAAEEQPSEDDSLGYDGLRLTGPVNVESGEWRLVVPGTGAQKWRLIVPGQGPASITLDYAFPPAWNESNEGPGGQFDHPTRPTPPPRDDSNLLAKGTFSSITFEFTR